MKSTAIVVALSIFFFYASGWSEIKYFKIPSPEKKPDEGQTTTPQKPAETKPTQTEETKKQPSADSPTKPADSKAGSPQTAPSTSQPSKTVRTEKQKPRGPYMTSIQIGSFENLGQARKEKSRLKALGIDAFIRLEKVSGKGNWYRVYVGRFNTKRQALDYQWELKRKGIIHWSWIKRIRTTTDQAPAVSATAKKPPPAAKAVPSPKPDRKEGRKPLPLKRPVESARETTAKAAPVKPKPKQPVVSKKDEPPAESDAGGEKKKAGRFSVGPRIGMLYSPGASDFRIIRTIGSDTKRWEFEDLKPRLGLCFEWSFSDNWSLETVWEKVVLTNLDMQYLTLGPRWRFKDSGTIRPYLRTGLVYGSLAWDDAPGSFDSSIGAEAGFGIDFIGTDFSFGLEAAYRYSTFDYTPSGTGVTATDSQIDFSGFTLTGIARAHF